MIDMIEPSRGTIEGTEKEAAHMKINDVIRTRRQALGLTQEALAERLGVSGPAVNKWEKKIGRAHV